MISRLFIANFVVKALPAYSEATSCYSKFCVMKKLLFYLSLCCCVWLAACTEDPLVDEGSGGDEIEQPEDTLIQAPTIDGLPPFVKLEELEQHVAAYPDRWLNELRYETNLQNQPQIQIVAEDTVEQFVQIERLSNSEIEYTLSVNYTNQERVNYIQFKTGKDSLLAAFKVIQERGAVYELAEEKSTINSLKFRFTTNGNVNYVHYGLSHKELYDDEEVYSFLEGSSIDAQQDRIGKMELGEGAHEFNLSFDGLKPNTPYYLYVASSPNNYVYRGKYLKKQVSTAVFESKHDLVMTMSANPTNDFTVILPFGNVVIGTINWGDGTSEQITHKKGMIQHKYEVSKTKNYIVRFSGHLEALYPEPYASSAHRQSTLVAINQWGVTGLKRIDLGGFSSLTSIASDTEGGFASVEHFGVEPYGGSFSDTNIESIPADLFKYAVSATSFDNTFRGCEKLKSIPTDLFKYTVNVTSFSSTFDGCKNLKTLPGTLFDHTPKVTNFDFTFSRCEQLEQLPAGLFAHTPEVRSFRGTFYGCHTLKSIPANLFANCKWVKIFGLDHVSDIHGGYRGGGGVFEDCLNLQSIPENLFASCSNAVNLSYAFSGCKALQSIPANLFRNSKGIEQIENVFAGCKSLTAIPHALFDNNRRLINVQSAFEGCNNLTGESPYTTIEVDGKSVKVHLYERRHYPFEFAKLMHYSACFNGCSKLTDWDNMKWN